MVQIQKESKSITRKVSLPPCPPAMQLLFQEANNIINFLGSLLETWTNKCVCVFSFPFFTQLVAECIPLLGRLIGASPTISWIGNRFLHACHFSLNNSSFPSAVLWRSLRAADLEVYCDWFVVSATAIYFCFMTYCIFYMPLLKELLIIIILGKGCLRVGSMSFHVYNAGCLPSTVPCI